MAQKTQYTCDVCGTPRQKSNHWYIVDDSWPVIITVRPWNDSIAGGSSLHLCGEVCVMKKLSATVGAPIRLEPTLLEAEACATK